MNAVARPWALSACLACTALMIVVPPLNPVHLAPLPTFIEEWLAIGFGTAAVAFALWARRLRLGEVPRVVPWLVGFAVLLAAQAAVRDLPYREQALLPALYVLWCAALAWTASVLRNDLGGERTARALAACVFLVARISAAFALIQASGVQTPLNWLISRPQTERVYGNLNQPNLLANLLALGSVSAVFLRCNGTLGRAAAGAGIVLLAAGMALTGSRTGFAFVAWTVAWAAWWTRACPGDTSREALRLAIFLTVGFLVVQLALALFGASTTSVPATRMMGSMLAEEGPASLSVRRYIWAQAIHMFGASPLFGVGPGMFSWNFFVNAPEFAGIRVPGAERFAHDLVLQLLAETGLVGALLVVVPLVAWLGSNLRSPAEPWRWWCVAFVGIGGLHSLVENPLWYAHFLGPFAAVLGLGDRGAYGIKRESVSRIAAPALVLIGTISLAGAGAGYLETMAWLRGTRADATLAPMQRSLLRPYAEMLASSVSMPPDRFDPDDVALSGRLVRFMPIDLAVYRHIRVLSQADRAGEARYLLDRAAIVYPDTLDDLRRELRGSSANRGARDLLRLLGTRERK
jgi:O-antigen ligase